MGRAFEDVKILISFSVSASWREKNWIIFNDKWCLTKNISQILKYYFLKRKKTLHLQSRTKRVWFGTIAQLVEQRTENPCVAGSIPAGTTKLHKTTTTKTKINPLDNVLKGFFILDYSGKQRGTKEK